MILETPNFGMYGTLPEIMFQVSKKLWKIKQATFYEMWCRLLYVISLCSEIMYNVQRVNLSSVLKNNLF